jgi:hypothetical protein
VFGRSLLWLGIAFALGCGADAAHEPCGDKPCNGPTGLPCRCGALLADDAGLAKDEFAQDACEHYFAAQYMTPCAVPAPQAAELARIKPRFISACLNQIAAPGSGMTPNVIEACANALAAIGCQWQYPPAACDFHGSLPGGAACNEAMQCRSGNCQNMVNVVSNPAGPQNAPIHCGTCTPALREGASCGTAGDCAAGFECMTTLAMTSAPNPVYTCTKVNEGEAGARCDELTALCKPGLYCNAGSCSALHTNSGDACGAMSGPNGCMAPLTCSDQRICLPPAAPGESCAGNQRCADGLVCNSMQHCEPLTWAEPGTACDETTYCRISSCPRLSSPVGAGTCPVIAADGETCQGQFNCDAFSDCLDGVCVLRDSVVCR